MRRGAGNHPSGRRQRCQRTRERELALQRVLAEQRAARWPVAGHRPGGTPATA